MNVVHFYFQLVLKLLMFFGLFLSLRQKSEDITVGSDHFPSACVTFTTFTFTFFFTAQIINWLI